MTQAGTIAVAYAGIGSGHRVAAEAIAEELRKMDENVTVELVDVLDFARPAVSGNGLTRAFVGPTGALYDSIWSRPHFGAAARRVAAPFLYAMFRGFGRWLEETRPSVVVSTHALPAMLAVHACANDSIDCRVVAIATDYAVHGFWPRDGIDLFCVADTYNVERLVERGFAPTAVVATGMPVRPQFTLEYERNASRRHFDLPEDERVVLAIAGSALSGPYERMKASLSVSLPALASLPSTTVAVVCGKDDALIEELRSRAAGFGTTNVHVFGYVERMAPLMACADLIIAKPGGAVCAEAMAAGVPMVLMGPAVGQEGANARRLSEAGAVLYAADPLTLAEHTRKALSQTGRLARMREAAASLGRPFAAADIAEKVLALSIRR